MPERERRGLGGVDPRDLLACYYPPLLFDWLLAGEDVLISRHANTAVAEVQVAPDIEREFDTWRV